MRNYSTAVKNALAAGNPTAILFDLNLVDGSYYLTDSQINIDHELTEYLATALVLDYDPFVQKSELSVLDYNIQFTAVDQTILALFRANNQQNKTIKLTKVILDYDYSVIGELSSTTVIIDNYAQTDDIETSTMTVNCSNIFGAWQATRGIVTTQASFQRFVPNSTSFINSKDTSDLDKWGGK